MANLEYLESTYKMLCLVIELSQPSILHPIFSTDLAYEELRVGEDFHRRIAQLSGLSEAKKEGFVFSDVVCGLPDVGQMLLPDRARLVPEDDTDPRWPRIASSRPIDVQDERSASRLTGAT
jgi:hypothetical protein